MLSSQEKLFKTREDGTLVKRGKDSDQGVVGRALKEEKPDAKMNEADFNPNIMREKRENDCVFFAPSEPDFQSKCSQDRSLLKVECGCGAFLAYKAN